MVSAVALLLSRRERQREQNGRLDTTMGIFKFEYMSRRKAWWFRRSIANAVRIIMRRKCEYAVMLVGKDSKTMGWLACWAVVH